MSNRSLPQVSMPAIVEGLQSSLKINPLSCTMLIFSFAKGSRHHDDVSDKKVRHITCIFAQMMCLTVNLK